MFEGLLKNLQSNPTQTAMALSLLGNSQWTGKPTSIGQSLLQGFQMGEGMRANRLAQEQKAADKQKEMEIKQQQLQLAKNRDTRAEAQYKALIKAAAESTGDPESFYAQMGVDPQDLVAQPQPGLLNTGGQMNGAPDLMQGYGNEKFIEEQAQQDLPNQMSIGQGLLSDQQQPAQALPSTGLLDQKQMPSSISGLSGLTPEEEAYNKRVAAAVKSAPYWAMANRPDIAMRANLAQPISGNKAFTEAVQKQLAQTYASMEKSNDAGEAILQTSNEIKNLIQQQPDLLSWAQGITGKTLPTALNQQIEALTSRQANLLRTWEEVPARGATDKELETLKAQAGNAKLFKKAALANQDAIERAIMRKKYMFNNLTNFIQRTGSTFGFEKSPERMQAIKEVVDFETDQAMSKLDLNPEDLQFTLQKYNLQSEDELTNLIRQKIRQKVEKNYAY